MKKDKNKKISPKERFHKITDFVVEKSSPQSTIKANLPSDKEAEAIVKFRKSREFFTGK